MCSCLFCSIFFINGSVVYYFLFLFFTAGLSCLSLWKRYVNVYLLNSNCTQLLTSIRSTGFSCHYLTQIRVAEFTLITFQNAPNTDYNNHGIVFPEAVHVVFFPSGNGKKFQFCFFFASLNTEGQ